MNVVFMLVEVAVGLIANSVALLSDAAHMLTDAAAIGLALVAVRLAAGRRRAASPSASAVGDPERAAQRRLAAGAGGVLAFEAMGR